ALHCFRNGDLERTLKFARTVMEREPGPESSKNVAVALASLGRNEEAANWIEGHRETFHPIEYHDLLCAQFRVLGRVKEAIAQGDQALRLKDEAVPTRDLPNPIVRPFDVDRRSRN